MNRGVLLLGVMLWLLGTSPVAGAQVESPTVYVGTVSSSDALIAIVVQDGMVLAYSCGGVETLQTHTTWFRGEVEQVGNTSLLLTNSDGFVFQGRFLQREAGDVEAEGTLMLADGTVLRWHAEAAKPDSPAGLYRLSEEEAVAGLIVANDLSFTGAIRLIIPRSGDQLEPLLLAQELPQGPIEGLLTCFSTVGDNNCQTLPRISALP